MASSPSNAGRAQLVVAALGMRRPSVGSLGSSSEVSFKLHDNYLADLLSRINARVEKFFTGSESKSMEQEKLDKMAEIIKTYRGVAEEEEDELELPICDRPAFDVFMSVVILLNTFVIGLETDLSDRFSPSREWYWAVLEFIFTAIFVAEVCVKVKYHGRRWPLQTPMNAFCTLIAILTVFDFVILYPLREFEILNMKGLLRMLSLLRIIGLLRLAKIVRNNKSLEELRLVLQGMQESVMTITWIVILIIVFLYISAIIATKVIGQNRDVYKAYLKQSGGWDHEEFFGTVGRSMCTLLQVMTLDSWSSRVARHVIANQWYMSLFFLGFLLLATHGLLNVVVSVIVQHTLSAASTNETRLRVRRERQRRAELDTIGEIFEMADEDGSGDLTLEEFQQAAQNPEVKWRLRQLGLGETDAVRLFTVIDGTGTRILKIKEFINGCSKLKGPAMSKDLLAIQAQADMLAKRMDTLSVSLSESEKMMSALDEVTLRITQRYAPAVRGTRERIAHNKGGAEPVIRPPKLKAEDDHMSSFGNRPALPALPSLLN